MRTTCFSFIPIVTAALAVTAAYSSAQVPQVLNYQGKVKVNGTDFTGSGQFKFALVNAAGSQSYWSNDGATTNGTAPTTTVTLPVQGGLYSVLLGDATVPQMAALPAGVFSHSDVRLRVWFNDGVNGWQQLTPDQRVAAVGYALMSETVPDASLTSAKLADGAVTSTKIAAGAVTEAAFAPDAVLKSLEAGGHTTVPDGAAMISADPDSAALEAAGYVQKGRLTSSDTWAPISGGTAASQSVAVWTGTEMLLWGDVATGYRYNPTTNIWSAMSTTGQPDTRFEPIAVWTGTEMVVWGGFNSTTFPSTSGKYNPTTNTWTTVTTTNAPAGRWGAAVVWTGSEMMIWGGGTTTMNNTGYRYNPNVGVGGTWGAFATTTGAPSARQGASAVWTGTEMLVWGGENGAGTSYADGARYNPITGTWTAMAASGLAARSRHSAVWTGTRMLIWGGNAGTTLMNSGGSYDPVTNTWTTLNAGDAPIPRSNHSTIWTGTEMVVWGGHITAVDPLIYANTGGRYNPATDTWLATELTGAPSTRTYNKAVWTGTEMIIWGGTSGSARLNTGGRYRVGNTLYLYQRP